MPPRAPGRLRLAAIALAALLASAGAHAAEPSGDGAVPDPLPTWYAQALARGPGGLNVTHFWSKGPNLRAETVIAGHRVVTIVRGETYYAYDRTLGNGVAIQRSGQAMAIAAAGGRPFGNEVVSLLRQGAEKVREEEILGRKCDVYRITDERGKRELWATQDDQLLPLRVEIYHRHSGLSQYVDYLNWQTGLPVPDSFFEVDPGIELQRYQLEEYLQVTASQGPVSPVPVLYADLLQGPGF